jgi:hypothetical protein
MVNQEKLKELTKEELLLYNELIEKDIKEVAYYACLLKHKNILLDKMWWNKHKEVQELKKKLHCFIGSGY